MLSIRRSLRRLRAMPVYSATMTLTFAVGIAATTLVFSVVNGLLLRPPTAVRDVGALARIGRGTEEARLDVVSYPLYRALRDGARGLSGVTAFGTVPSFLEDASGSTSPGAIQLTSANFFSVLASPLALGRGFTPDEELHPGGDAVAVLSHDMWRRGFGADSSVIGRRIRIHGHAFVVVGVAAPGFVGVETLSLPPAAWVPITMFGAVQSQDATRLDNEHYSWLSVIGRMTPGGTLPQVNAGLRALNADLRRTQPGVLAGDGLIAIGGVAIGIRPRDAAQVRRTSALLLGFASLVFLISCTNAAGLSASRSQARTGEAALMLALGAPGRRVVGTIAGETMLLALAGTVVAIGIVAAATRGIPAVMPYDVAAAYPIDLRVLAAAATGCVVAVLLAALAPSLRVLRHAGLRSVISAHGAGSATKRSQTGRVLVVVQIAICFPLLTAALLLSRSVMAAERADPGFATRDVFALTFSSSTPEAQGSRDAVALLAEAQRVFPQSSVGLVGALPLADEPALRSPVDAGALENMIGPPPEPVVWTIADSGYFAALGIPLVRGRPFSTTDGAQSRAVAIVTEAFARRFWPGATDVVGRELPFGDGRVHATVVGIARDHRFGSLRESPRAAVYFPRTQRPAMPITLVVRAARSDMQVDVNAQLETLARKFPDVQTLRVANLHSLVRVSFALTETIARLASVFGLIATLLALLGVHAAVLQSLVAQQRDAAIRMAVGAAPRSIASALLGDGLRLTVVGLVIGVICARPMLEALRALLLGVGPTDMLSLSLAALGLTLLSATAAWVAARRVLRTDIMSVLAGG